jgi:hypothetical protein
MRVDLPRRLRDRDWSRVAGRFWLGPAWDRAVRELGANSWSWSGSAVDPSWSRRAILGSAPVSVGPVPRLKHEVAEAARVRRSDGASLPEEAGQHLRAREWGAAGLLARRVARAPRGCISRDTPLRRVTCLIGPKCQDEGVMISISPETGAARPGAMGSLPIAEALKGVTAEQGASRPSSHEVRSHGPLDFPGQITDWPPVSMLQSPSFSHFFPIAGTLRSEEKCFRS